MLTSITIPLKRLKHYSGDIIYFFTSPFFILGQPLTSKKHLKLECHDIHEHKFPSYIHPLIIYTLKEVGVPLQSDWVTE